MLVALVLIGCDNSGPADEPSAVPAPGLTSFTQGGLDGLPVFRGATLVDGPTSSGSTLSAGYETETATPQRVMSWYEDRLAQEGWQLVEPVRESSAGTTGGWITGDWIRDDRRLHVLARPYEESRPGAFDDATQTRFELVLLPNAADTPIASIG